MLLSPTPFNSGRYLLDVLLVLELVAWADVDGSSLEGSALFLDPLAGMEPCPISGSPLL